ncbi:hypothetical protein RUR49_20265 [Pseudoxanthobacter sp. M-2]|uniref:hypothetical protein n=1 Tax=Pseudoxanthobacter sp. M-2 TaxID=3078754 RepID=UPI0038FC26DA
MTTQVQPPPEPRGPVTTADALRSRIDRGDGSDKVDFPDPAASPLGTDDEAAGTPPTRSDVAQAAAHELSRPPADAPADVHERVPTRLREGRGIPAWVWVLAGLMIAGAVTVAVVSLA